MQSDYDALQGAPHHLLRHQVTERVGLAAAAGFAGADAETAGSAILQLRQPHLRQTFQAVFGVHTNSGNNEWMRGKLLQFVGLDTRWRPPNYLPPTRYGNQAGRPSADKPGNSIAAASLPNTRQRRPAAVQQQCSVDRAGSGSSSSSEQLEEPIGTTRHDRTEAAAGAAAWAAATSEQATKRARCGLEGCDGLETPASAGGLGLAGSAAGSAAAPPAAAAWPGPLCADASAAPTSPSVEVGSSWQLSPQEPNRQHSLPQQEQQQVQQVAAAATRAPGYPPPQASGWQARMLLQVQQQQQALQLQQEHRQQVLQLQAWQAQQLQQAQQAHQAQQFERAQQAQQAQHDTGQPNQRIAYLQQLALRAAAARAQHRAQLQRALLTWHGYEQVAHGSGASIGGQAHGSGASIGGQAHCWPQPGPAGPAGATAGAAQPVRLLPAGCHPVPSPVQEEDAAMVSPFALMQWAAPADSPREAAWVSARQAAPPAPNPAGSEPKVKAATTYNFSQAPAAPLALPTYGAASAPPLAPPKRDAAPAPRDAAPTPLPVPVSDQVSASLQQLQEVLSLCEVPSFSLICEDDSWRQLYTMWRQEASGPPS